jgi:predicted dehydrogenase
MKLNQMVFAGFIFLLMTISNTKAQPAVQKPIRLGISGMTHGHIAFILGRKDKGDFKLVGICEPDSVLARQLSKRYGFDLKLVYSNLNEMLEKTRPEAVVAFGSIFEHLATVEACAPRGIHVMVEKPLATNMEQARRMVELAEKHHIHLLTDYETSWYPTTAKSFQLVNDSNFVGTIRKVVVHDGHQGPKEIGCDKYFLNWLTDPVQNGGGAIVDFGCYGANLMTYLMKGERPVSVTAVTRQFKPEVYPKVDDDATILLNYPGAEAIIQASWNWPFGRKDMEIYGNSGYIFAENNQDMRLRKESMPAEQMKKITSKDIAVYEDPFSYFADVIHGKVTLTAYDPYSLSNNVTVVKILDAARESAKTGKTVVLKN